jgi:retron-type reverse transcriptase
MMIGSSKVVRGRGTIHSNVFDNIISVENLLKAWKEFKRGKTKKKDILEFDFYLEENIFSLHKELKDKTYNNQSYIAFFVYDPKRRHIHKACVKDRVVHQAIYRVLYDIYDKSFIHDSYSCRIKKGTHRGVSRLEEFVRKESKNYSRNIWVLKCDISKYFDSIDHNILKDIIFRKKLDENTKWLIEKIIKSFEKSPNKGLPLGNVTSQLFANIYLNKFDQFIKYKLKVKYYLRYCDDFAIVSKDKKYLELLLPPIANFLKSGLDLTLHPKKVEIRKLSQGIDYLGYIILPYYRILRTNTKKRIMRKFREGIKEESKQSYLGVLSHCSGYKIQKMLSILND